MTLESAAFGVPLFVHSTDPSSVQPVTFGVPLPDGWLQGPGAFVLEGPTGERTPCQVQPVAWWGSGAVQWLQVRGTVRGHGEGKLLRQEDAEGLISGVEVVKRPTGVLVGTGALQWEAARTSPALLDQLRDQGGQLLARQVAVTFRSGRGLRRVVQWTDVSVEVEGPLQSVIRLEGRLGGRRSCRVLCRATVYQGSGLVRLDVTLHNPRRAAHRGGQWDLGDPQSERFRQFGLEITLEGNPVGWQARVSPEQPMQEGQQPWSVYQASSGGQHWQSRTHVDATGEVRLPFQGYQLETDGKQQRGLRAQPGCVVRTDRAQLGVWVPDFWQNFPKRLAIEGASCRIELFPDEETRLHELQGGERKTHTVWLQLQAAEGPADSLQQPPTWLGESTLVLASPAWVVSTGAVSHLMPEGIDPTSQLEPLLQAVVAGPERYEARREVIDEYGWRHYGEIWADHEQAYFKGAGPVISHYNNQYDFLYGLYRCALRSGDMRWMHLAIPLARHVMDIDIYHTREDKAAYSGGMFWHTDHYLSAETCSHRTYSKANEGGRTGYGGGPSSQHNFTSGLLLHYYLTGDLDARAAVVGLAEWVVNMDDGQRNVLGVLIDQPTGWATATFDFHGPGRGAGWSINALLDAWRLTGDRQWLVQAEQLIRRTVHPSDEPEQQDLANAELRWSYTIFLSVLATYLDFKRAYDVHDPAFAYARDCLVRYAVWMVDHDGPYFDRKETLEFPTESWAGQEMRKANVLRRAAAYVDDPLRQVMLQRGEQLSARAWQDLLGFESRTVARSMAIWMTEGTRDAVLRMRPDAPSRVAVGVPVGEKPGMFVAQKAALKELIRSPQALGRAVGRLLEVERWKRLLRQDGSMRP